jgi:hypothetical protein
MRATTGPQSHEIWAITAYFNPMRYRRRLANFRTFRHHLQLPLVAVELAYGAEFELEAQDAEVLIQLRGGAMLWQKERLLNVALQALPSHCHKVAWLDCDIIFATPSWVEAANSLLDQFAIIQPFRQAHYLSAQWAPGMDYASQVELTQPSATFLLASGISAATCLGHLIEDRKRDCEVGFAWAARRELLTRHLFYDACILGGGDRALACAAHYCLEGLMQRHRMNERERQRYIAWAEPFWETVRAQTTFLDEDIFHLWHGDIINRRKGRAREGFQRFQFDPYTDVAIAENGSWRWNTDKDEMHNYVRTFFASRREDG